MKAVLLSLFASLLLFPCFSYADDQRTISVSGTSVTHVVPDTVVWSVTITSSHPQLSKAKQKSDSQIKSVLGVAKSLGAPEHCLQTGYLNVNKEYERGRHGQRTAFKHFTITRTVTIKSTDTGRFDDYLTALIKNDDMKVSYKLETTKIGEVRWETRLKAMAVAKKKAIAMTQALGAKIGIPLKINEGPGGRMMHANVNEYTFADRGTLSDMSGGTFAPGSIPVTVTVGVVFALN